MPSLTELLTVPSGAAGIDLILNGEVLPAMRGRGLNVTAWSPLDPWRTLSYVVATLRQSVRLAIATFTAAGFGDYVFGRATPPGGLDVTTWAGLRAASWYQVTAIAATYTKRRIRLTNASSGSYGPLVQGSIILRFTATGNRYVQDDDNVTIPGADYVDVVFRSEFVVDTASGRNYADSSDATIQFVTSQFPGVTATNPAPTYSDVAQVGYGLGTLTLGGSPSGSPSVAVRIDSSGQSGVATWSTSLNGAAYVSHSASASVTNLGGLGIDITLTNDGGGSSPSFLAGAYYYFSAPGSDVTVPGRDAETPQQLGARCLAIWPTFAFAKDVDGNWIPFNPTMSAAEALTRFLSDQVAIVLVRTDATVNNKLHILVAGQGALLPSATLALIALYWQTRSGLTDLYDVAAPSTTAIVLADATVTAKASLIAAGKAAAQQRVYAYLTGVDPNNRITIGDGVAVIDRSYLNSLIRTSTGVTHLDDGLTINGVADDFVIPLDNLATYAGDVGTSLTWVPG